MSINLRFYKFTGLSFSKLMDHDHGGASFIGMVSARETCSDAATQSEITFTTTESAVTRKFERAIAAFNAAMNLPDEELSEADVDLTPEEKAKMAEYLEAPEMASDETNF